MGTIRDLIGKVQDVNLGNRYEVILYLPDKLKAEWNFKVDDITFYCDKCQIPGLTAGKIERQIYGEPRNLGTIVNSADTVEMSYIFDYKGLNIHFFEAWANLVMNPETKRIGYYDDYVGTIEINILNNLNKPILSCVLLEAWPEKINDLELSYTNTEFLPIEIAWQFRSRLLRYPDVLNLRGVIQNLEERFANLFR